MDRSPLLDRHRAAGARLQDGAAGSVLTFGDVPAEYRAATESAGLFDETDRGLLRVTGADAADFLHRLLANDVRGLEPGSGDANLLLTAKGKIRFVADLARDGDGFLLSTAPGEAAGLLAALDTYHFTEAVELADATGEHAPLALVGPDAERVLGAVLEGEPPRDDHAWRALRRNGRDVRVTRRSIAGSPGWRVDGGPELAADLWDALTEAGAAPCGLVVRDILRVEAGAAEPGIDVDENVYPQEARLESAFSLEKGCYVGQEVVAKIDTYGGLNKRLVALRLAHDDPIPRGTAVVSVEDGEERELGLVTSWAYSFVLDTGLVLAYLKRRHQDVGMRFTIGGADAEIVALPVRAGAVPVTPD